ncbi:hypothetical protein [Candidatus Bandiella euplotis]|uniref:Uncharacterized protein n=1 Tax=Candidatus Bandiella euplotis TaxID=1664265 RepID=A0ABZ0UJ91_9RICK|nr:hypothetical protein [Candidatus Bandiella woodruffii]WPX96175.1 hypothetical protein Bandiella_00284 [Candidatus Bandiella woodruffii]
MIQNSQRLDANRNTTKQNIQNYIDSGFNQNINRVLAKIHKDLMQIEIQLNKIFRIILIVGLTKILTEC